MSKTSKSFKVYGLDELALAIHRVKNIPDDVKSNLAKAGAEVLAEGTRKVAREMDIYDEESDVHIVDKIKTSKPNIKNKISCSVTFSGNRKRGTTKTRNAEIAFINEFGANNKGIPGKPFMYNANKKYSNDAVDAASEVFYNWLFSNNL